MAGASEPERTGKSRERSVVVYPAAASAPSIAHAIPSPVNGST